MSENGRSYASYIHLQDLLNAQVPLTPPCEEAAWLAERFFILCHQTSELWTSQILLDINLAAAAAEAADWRTAEVSLSRAMSVALLLSSTLRQLRHLPREHFLQFRVALNGTSAAESEQFRELLLGRRHDAVQRVQARLDVDSHVPGGGYCLDRCTHAMCGAASALYALTEAIADWRSLHVDFAQYFIGDLPGTGGTSGVAYLRERIEVEEPVQLRSLSV
jgi:tryptophan 2,3-dioxygenase